MRGSSAAGFHRVRCIASAVPKDVRAEQAEMEDRAVCPSVRGDPVDQFQGAVSLVIFSLLPCTYFSPADRRAGCLKILVMALEEE